MAVIFEKESSEHWRGESGCCIGFGSVAGDFLVGIGRTMLFGDIIREHVNGGGGGGCIGCDEIILNSEQSELILELLTVLEVVTDDTEEELRPELCLK